MGSDQASEGQRVGFATLVRALASIFGVAPKTAGEVLPFETHICTEYAPGTSRMPAKKQLDDDAPECLIP